MDSLTRNAVDETREHARLRRRGDMWRAVAFFFIAVCAVLFASKVLGDAVPVPADAVGWADEDSETLHPSDAPYVRYLFDQYRDGRWVQNYMLFLSAYHASSPTVFTPKDHPEHFSAVEPVPGSESYVFRVDFKKLCPDEKDRTRVLLLFDNMLLARNTYFQMLREGTEVRTVPGYVWDGKVWNTASIRKTVAARHLGGFDDALLNRWARLVVRLSTPNPIMHSRQCLRLFWSELDGGVYYGLRGIEKNPAQGTAEQAWFAKVGGDPDLATKLLSKERAGVEISRVTGGPRAVEWFPIVRARLSLGPGVAFITRDFIENTAKEDRHPGYNLLATYEPGGNTHDASEAMAVWDTIEFVLFDGKGALQDEAPGNVVSDRSVPEPHPTRLQSIRSCVACHIRGNRRMYPEVTDEVSLMLAGGVNVFGELGDPEDRQRQYDKLASLYDGDPLPVLEMARTTHANAVHYVTAGEMSVTEVAGACIKAYDEYYYGANGMGVSTRVACYEFGYEVADDKEAKVLLNKLFPRLEENQVGYSPESYVVGRLKLGMNVSRERFDAEYSPNMNRLLREQIAEHALNAP